MPNSKPFMKIPIHFIETPPQEIHAVCLYTRRQAVAAGWLIDVTMTARETGIGVPTFITRAVFETYVAVSEEGTGQDETGRLRDLLLATRDMIQRANPGLDRLAGNNNPKRVKLVAVCSPLDLDDPQPAMTLMLSEEY
jgi:hypothetical protein